jgi:hypothetical protein
MSESEDSKKIEDYLEQGTSTANTANTASRAVEGGPPSLEEFLEFHRGDESSYKYWLIVCNSIVSSQKNAIFIKKMIIRDT